MTDEPRTICKRCGFANIPGDQFCGSCGAFLEWEGQPAGAGGPATTDAAPPATADAAPTTATGAAAGQAAWGAPYGDPIPNPVRPSMPEPEPDEDGDGVADGPLVRCPACGIANASNRTFCQSCGTTLATAARVEEPAREQVAAAVAWTPTPPPSPVVGATTARGRPGGARGIPGWVIGIGVVGLLVGVAIVLAGLALRGNPPGTGTEPSGAAPSGAAAGSASPGASASATAASPGAAKALTLTATASSVAGDLPRYQPSKAVDGDPKTSWQEGMAQEKGQWIQVAFAAARADTLVIRNGAQASAAQFGGNRRLKDITIKVGGKTIPFRLKDTMKAQTIDLGGVTGATSVRITIVSTYAGQATTAPNTPTDNAAVSEITVLGLPGG